jgi:predicted dehydrogenase
MQPVRIALLGSGFVADFYMQGLANVRGHEVVINYSRSLDRARLFAERWSIPEFTNLQPVVSRDDIDLFLIALPNEEHLPVSLALSALGRNQVCTKPLGRSREEGRLMFEAAQAAYLATGAIHGYAETEVFAPAVVRAKETVDKGGVGRVLWVRSRESHSGPHSPHFWDIDNTGGGALNDLGCHCIEAARYFFGKNDKVTEVMAWGANLVHRDKTRGEDNALLLLQMASGGVAHCELSWTTKGGLDLRNEIHGSDGSIFTDVTRQTPVAAFAGKSSGYVVEKADLDFGWIRPLPEEAFAYGYHAEMRHFVECVRDRVLPRENYEDGFVVNCILDAGYQSMREHRWVPVSY